jgi:hypothetical protein
MWLLCSFQGPGEAYNAGSSDGRRAGSGASGAGELTPVSQNSTACWTSLPKTVVLPK